MRGKALTLSVLFQLVWGLGVAQAQSPALPESVARASASVFRYIPLRLGGTGEKSSASEREKALATTCQEPASFLKKLRCDFIREQCPTDGECFIPFVETGTAFLVGDGFELVSALHVMLEGEMLSLSLMGGVMATFSPERLQEIYAGYRADFLLFDSDGVLVYDTRLFDGVHKFTKLGDPLKATGQTTGDEMLPAGLGKFGFDFARARVRRRLGEGLKFGRAVEASIASPHWALGFPNRTTGRVSNYDGFRIYANPGLRYTLAELAEAFKFEVKPGLENYPLLAVTNDIVPGFSGGPLFNESGEVVGILTSTLSDESTFRGLAFAAPITVLEN